MTGRNHRPSRRSSITNLWLDSPRLERRLVSCVLPLHPPEAPSPRSGAPTTRPPRRRHLPRPCRLGYSPPPAIALVSSYHSFRAHAHASPSPPPLRRRRAFLPPRPATTLSHRATTIYPRPRPHFPRDRLGAMVSFWPPPAVEVDSLAASKARPRAFPLAIPPFTAL